MTNCVLAWFCPSEAYQILKKGNKFACLDTVSSSEKERLPNIFSQSSVKGNKYIKPKSFTRIAFPVVKNL